MEDEREHVSRGSGFEWFFIGLALAIVPGVALVFFGLDYAVDNITTIALGFLGALFAVAILGGLIYIFRHRLMKRASLKADATLADVARAVGKVQRLSHPEADPEERAEAVEDAGQTFASWYSWLSTRRWIVRATIAMFVAFAALVGSVILFRQLEVTRDQLAAQVRQNSLSAGQLEMARGQLEALGVQIEQARLQNELVSSQNDLIKDQNEYFQDQNAKIQKQLDDQAADTKIVRRAQLLTTIYELSDCDRSKLEEGEPCPPKAASRLRVEAVLTLAKLEGRDLDLADADLSALQLRGVNLSGAYLGKAKLRGTRLDGSNFEDARLVGASLEGAIIRGANFRGANLSNADLNKATFGSLFDPFPYPPTDLRGANLSGARGPVEHHFTFTCGDSETRTSGSSVRPRFWLDRPWGEGDPADAGCPPETGALEPPGKHPTNEDAQPQE